MSTLVGLQLIIYWVLLRVLEELSQREILAKRDLAGYGQLIWSDTTISKLIVPPQNRKRAYQEKYNE
jgi:hypothetical protein